MRDEKERPFEGCWFHMSLYSNLIWTTLAILLEIGKVSEEDPVFACVFPILSLWFVARVSRNVCASDYLSSSPFNYQAKPCGCQLKAN